MMMRERGERRDWDHKSRRKRKQCRASERNRRWQIMSCGSKIATAPINTCVTIINAMRHIYTASAGIFHISV